jgi:hypothetical protein
MRVLPVIEEMIVYGTFNPNARYTGWVGGDAWGGNVENRDKLRGKYFDFMLCPSSDLPPFVLTSEEHAEANVMSATYTGVAGATDHATAKNKSGTGGATGRISWGGALITQRSVKLAEITDGTTHTLLVVEQSDYCLDPAGERVDCRSDCGHGFPMVRWAGARTAGNASSI